MKYYTREEALNVIWHHCTHKFGFDYAFAQATWLFISDLMDCIDNNKPMSRITYSELLDFLDGNGFKVKGNDADGYTITLA